MANFAVNDNVLVDFDSHGPNYGNAVYKFFDTDWEDADGIGKVNVSVIIRDEK